MVATPTAESNKMREVNTLLEEGRRLQNRLADLGAALRQAAAELDEGRPPSPDLAASLVEVSQAFDGLHARVQRLLGGGPIEPLLPKVLEALEAHRKALEAAALRQQALNVLEQVSSLVYRGGEEFLPLSAVQFDALGLMRQQKESTELNATVLALANGSHPYNLLIKLVVDKGMSNEEWVRVYQQVAQEIGQDIAVAAARGQIVLPE
ncbi:hypothetical protein Mtai_v1c04940 [Meiothermus taiwanensis WR-220]|jgi:hypothetical protein|uniref:Uncharacterized protein n=3 Tax=Meiothermus taiwanensis TaxID=172827 RepID=A0A399DWY2_9DEIN|nr:hypothetical protein Mtai_v1c04940 [Meiothermus taiwanensis WR-220]RIH76695.1 hypothetical protein Mcate_01656 [Meiothermus taiwanensis]